MTISLPFNFKLVLLLIVAISMPLLEARPLGTRLLITVLLPSQIGRSEAAVRPNLPDSYLRVLLIPSSARLIFMCTPEPR